MRAVDVRAVSKTYAGSPPVAALSGVDLLVPAGSIVAVLGASGSGKSTLLRLIAGFERPDAGTIAIGDELVAGPGTYVPPERRGVAIVPQEGALFPHLDVGANVGFGLRKLERSERRARVAELLEMIGLSGLERRKPHELSGGQQQRVAVARALAPRPNVVLLDEPFTALDAGLRARLRADVATLLRAANTSALLVTHDPAEALAVADLVATMREGEIVQVGCGAELYREPADLETARLLGDVVLLPGFGRGRHAQCALGDVPLARGRDATGPCMVLLRPEQLTIDPTSSIRGTVVATQLHGHYALVEIEVNGVTVTARCSAFAVPPPGTPVGVTVVGGAVLVAAES